MNFKFNVPDYIKKVQEILFENKYECYLVGGCIRDMLLGLPVKDYDLTTNCDIFTLKKIFSNYSIVNNNGEMHNTITIHLNGNNVEITSYKHNSDEPNTLDSDLKHRDLTINSLAYSDTLVDIVGGLNDLKNKVLRAYHAEDRIKEDPLRILRILRFLSILDFKIEASTNDAIHKYKDLLNNVASERIKVELEGILSGKNIRYILNEYHDILFVIIPELKETYGFDQKNPYHHNTVYNHMVNVCSNVNMNLAHYEMIRMAALLHDIGKPLCFSIDESGIGHFYGHPVVSASIAFNILKRLRFSNDIIDKMIYLIKYHDSTINLTQKSIRKNLSKVMNQDEELFYMLIELINADRLDRVKHELIDINSVKLIINEIKEENLCLKLSDLKINGYDLMKLGFKGKEIGEVLNYLLENVMDDKIKNERNELIDFSKEYKKRLESLKP